MKVMLGLAVQLWVWVSKYKLGFFCHKSDLVLINLVRNGQICRLPGSCRSPAVKPAT